MKTKINRNKYILRFYNSVISVLKLVLVIWCFAFITGCAGGSKLSNQNLSYLYNPELEELHPQFHIVNLKDSVCRLFFKINATELLYTKRSGDSDFSANFAVSFSVLPAFEAREVADSASFVFEDRLAKPVAKDIISHVDFDSPRFRKYLVKISVTDLNRNQVAKSFQYVDNSTANSRNNFYLKKNEAEYPLFDLFLDSDEYTLNHRNKKITNLSGRYYRLDYPLAAPPFAIINNKALDFKADSLFAIKAGSSLKLHSEGIYHFQTDSSDYEGFTVFKFNENFPKVTTPREMLEPLRYITTKAEYTTMENSPNLKAAVEAFWIDAAETNDKGRELIKKYYTRVEQSNIHFTSYMEGWKTDRGLIYMIFGPPNVLYKNSETETWVYGEENNIMSLTFSFSKISNPFSENDFVLNRSNIYKSSWFRAVDTWRKGRVYTDN